MKALILPVKLRAAIEDDRAFIFDAWMKTMRSVMPYKAMPRALFHKEAKQRIQEIIDQSQVFVLCNPEDEAQLFSFVVGHMVGDIPVIHFAYTKSLYWRMGFMKRLLQEVFGPALATGAIYTHFAPSLTSFDWFVEDKPFQFYIENQYGFVFNPFMERK